MASQKMHHSLADAGAAREQTAAGGHEHRRLQEEQAVAGGPLRPIGGRQEASFLIYVQIQQDYTYIL